MTPIRPRRDTDIDRCIEIVKATRVHDGYPPIELDDYRWMFNGVPELGAWIADSGDDIAGHVALHPTTSPETIQAAVRATGLPDDAIGVVSRLFVAREHRRDGVARRLLDHATAAAHERGLHPVLDVATTLGPAIKLYEDAGWDGIGEVTLALPIGVSLPVLVFVGPAPPRR